MTIKLTRLPKRPRRGASHAPSTRNTLLLAITARTPSCSRSARSEAPRETAPARGATPTTPANCWHPEESLPERAQRPRGRRGPRITQCRTLCSPRFLTTAAQPSRKGLIKRPKKKEKKNLAARNEKSRVSCSATQFGRATCQTPVGTCTTRGIKKVFVFFVSLALSSEIATASSSSHRAFLSKAREFTR